jgi:hypothetical protein
MNLSNLKPAWQKFRLVNSMESIDPEEILLIIERAEGIAVSKTNRFFINTLLFIGFTFCCQGG